jgi:hypothetical protein
MRSLHRIRLRGVCVSSAGVGATGSFPSPNDITEPCDAPISDCGLGPAWSMPSCLTATAEEGDAVARSSRSRILGCKPSPRAAANVSNRSDEVISPTPTSCCCAINLNEQHCDIAPFLAFQLASLATTVLCRSRWNFGRGAGPSDISAAMSGRWSGRSECGRNAQGQARAGLSMTGGRQFPPSPGRRQAGDCPCVLPTPELT